MTSPWLRTAARSLVAAAPLALLLFLLVPRHAGLWSDAFDVFSVAFCFTFLGALFDVLLLALPGITEGPGWLVRFAAWFAGGLWCGVVGRWLWFRYARDLADLPGIIWGGVVMIVIQVLMLVIRNKRLSLK
jgi:hypothetical protein